MTSRLDGLWQSRGVRGSRRLIIGGLAAILAGGSSVCAALAAPGAAEPFQLWMVGLAGVMGALGVQAAAVSEGSTGRFKKKRKLC